MINLKHDKEYFILIDLEGDTFGGHRILEGKEEVFEQFAEWAKSDESNIDGESFGDLISRWTIDIKKYNGKEFVELSEEELNYKQ
jgi:hypothetical protein